MNTCLKHPELTVRFEQDRCPVCHMQRRLWGECQNTFLKALRRGNTNLRIYPARRRPIYAKL